VGPAHARAGLGIGRTFQHAALFRNLTVRDNVLAGAHPLARSGFLANALRLGGAVRREERAAEETARRLLALVDLESVADTRVAQLPFGTQKRVELARALAGGPRLLLLDEPASGLNHDEVYRLARLLFRIRREFKLSILLVEHHMNLVMTVSDRVVALDFGQVIADGTPAQVRAEPAVIRAYLGEGAAAAAAAEQAGGGHGDAA
jgi:branched-chain amino acid transport system ATP-binding protein